MNLPSLFEVTFALGEYDQAIEGFSCVFSHTFISQYEFNITTTEHAIHFCDCVFEPLCNGYAKVNFSVRTIFIQPALSNYEINTN